MVKTETALRIALILSGRYDIPGVRFRVIGRDAYGVPVSETIPAIDTDRLNADLAPILAALKPAL